MSDLMREAQLDEIQKIEMFLTVENGVRRHVQEQGASGESAPFSTLQVTSPTSLLSS